MIGDKREKEQQDLSVSLSERELFTTEVTIC